MKKFLLSLLALGLCAACGTEPKRLGDKKKAVPHPVCPSAVLVDYHEITLVTHQDLPERVAIELDGVVKVNECQAVAKNPPFALAGRKDKKTLVIHVDHYSAYPVLPNVTRLRMFDLVDCKVAPRERVPAIDVPLKFRQGYPYGEKCGDVYSANATMQGFAERLASE